MLLSAPLRQRRAAHALVVVVAAVVATTATSCGATPAGSIACAAGFVGDRSSPLALDIVALDQSMTLLPLQEGESEDLPLILPPQGGRIVLAGVRATNLDACAVTLSGSVRDLATRQVRLDIRTINLMNDGAGWATSDRLDISTFANVPLCPNQWSSTDVFGTTYELGVTLTDRDGRTATRTVLVVPTCSDPKGAAECRCICQAGYVLGQVCAAIASPPGRARAS